MKRLKWLILPVIVFGLTFCLFRFVLIIGYVPSASMEPTLKEKSYILGVRIHGDLKVGDIIIFEHEGSTMSSALLLLAVKQLKRTEKFILYLKADYLF